jgi:putative ABC transport system permease protein
VIRSSRERSDLASAVRREIAAVDKDQALSSVKTVEDYLSDSLSQRRFNMTLLALFAFIAAVLAAVGIYGVISYAVTQRTQEIGIRVALGAQNSDVVRMVIVQGMKPVIAGIFFGLAATYFLTRLMASLLYGVSATDPTTFVIVAAGLAAIAASACWIPARRAAKVDPVIALRYE